MSFRPDCAAPTYRHVSTFEYRFRQGIQLSFHKRKFRQDQVGTLRSCLRKDLRAA